MSPGELLGYTFTTRFADAPANRLDSFVSSHMLISKQISCSLIGAQPDVTKNTWYVRRYLLQTAPLDIRGLNALKKLPFPSSAVSESERCAVEQPHGSLIRHLLLASGHRARRKHYDLVAFQQYVTQRVWERIRVPRDTLLSPHWFVVSGRHTNHPSPPDTLPPPPSPP